MALAIYQVDAFTDRPFAGNPAAVCPLAEPRDAAWMQAVAREMNLSETAFPRPLGDGSWELRWFTPTVEVDLCGHATLASAHVLWETGELAADEPARFSTRSGRLSARRTAGGIELDFPADEPRPAELPPAVAAALGAEPVAVAAGREDLLVELDSEQRVRRLAPDVAAIGRADARGVIVTARAAGGGYDFVSRFFAPAAGVPEDPVTGSTHCLLAPYWAAKLGKSELAARQVSARGGELALRLAGDRVRIAGAAVTVMRGELLH